MGLGRSRVAWERVPESAVAGDQPADAAGGTIIFGIEEASVETEDPFGRDENCLDMETFTMGIARDAGQMAATKSAIVAIGRDQE